jgi:hypothetical protein
LLTEPYDVRRGAGLNGFTETLGQQALPGGQASGTSSAVDQAMIDPATFTLAQELVKEFPGPWSFCDNLMVYGTPEPGIELPADIFDQRVARLIVSIPGLVNEITRLRLQVAVLQSAQPKQSDADDSARKGWCRPWRSRARSPGFA